MPEIIGRQTKSVRNLGGKAVGLLSLERLGLTPPFVVVSAAVFFDFLKRHGLDRGSLSAAFAGPRRRQALRRRILSSSWDPVAKAALEAVPGRLKARQVIVRSSFCGEDAARHSYAGLFESHRCKSARRVARCVQHVWVSRFSERVARYERYRRAPALDMAVVIQEFVRPDLAGVCFVQAGDPPLVIMEFSERSHDAVTSGKGSAGLCVWRDGMLYVDADSCKDHSVALHDLAQKALGVHRVFAKDCDLEFVVSRRRTHFVQLRPLTRRVDIRRHPFLFGSRRYQWHVDDVGPTALHGFLRRRAGVDARPFRLMKRDGHLFVRASSYFSFVDAIKRSCRRAGFIDGLCVSNLRFIVAEQAWLGKARDPAIKVLVRRFKRFHIRADFFNFVLQIVRSHLEDIAVRQYGLEPARQPEYFFPEATLGAHILRETLSGVRRAGKEATAALLDRLTDRQREGILKRLRAHRAKVARIARQVDPGTRRFLEQVRKIVWLYDANDYFEEALSRTYQKKVRPFLKGHGVLQYYACDPGRVCRLPLAALDRIADKSYLVKFFRDGKSRRHTKRRAPSFPLQGTVACAGNVSGRARIIKRPGDAGKVHPGDIMVARYTCPSLVTAMAVCRGIITEEGGLTSHAAIVSRELGKPCIVGAAGCTAAIKERDRIGLRNGLITRKDGR